MKRTQEKALCAFSWVSIKCESSEKKEGNYATEVVTIQRRSSRTPK